MRVLIKCLIISFTLTSVCLAELLNFSGLTLDQVAQKILQETDNKVLNAKIDDQQGQGIYLIKVLTPTGRVQYLKINSNTGKLIKD